MTLLLTLLLASSYTYATKISLSVEAAQEGPIGANMIYVKADATGANNGTSWTNAYTDLQNALGNATNGSEIWVAASTYRASNGNRRDTFNLQNGVAIYGGFNRTETSRDQRNWITNLTTLSGDLDGNDNTNIDVDEPTRGDNSHHVVSSTNTNQTALLDGFLIVGGNADRGNVDGLGAGMYNSNSSATVSNITFRSNSANRGGGMANENSSTLVVSNVIFNSNSAEDDGGGMYNNNSTLTMKNVTFNGNSARQGGGMANEAGSNGLISFGIFSNNSANFGAGMHNDNSSPTVSHSTFRGNVATQHGGGIINGNNSHAIIGNSLFAGNSATQNGGAINNHNSSNPTINNVTITGNSAGRGGGVESSDSNVTISNSILWNNQGGGGAGANA